MEVHAFFPARYADQSEGLMNIIGGGLTHVRIDTLPFAFRSIAVVAKLLLDQNDVINSHTIKVRLVDPEGAAFFETDNFATPVDTLPQDMDYLNVNMGLVLTNLIFQTEGRYWFELLFDGAIIKRTPLRLRLNAANEPTVGQPIGTGA